MTKPLSSWENTPTKQAILDFVDSVTADVAKTFVPPAERIATFDNDGTLWCEQPLAQGAFIAQRLAAMAKADPSLRQTQPWKAISDGDSSWINNAATKHYNGDDTDLKSLIAGVVKAFGDITVEDFENQATRSTTQPCIPSTNSRIRSSDTCRWSSCSSTSNRMSSCATSCPVEAVTSCGRSPSRCTAYLPTGSSAAHQG
jgi:hypothetical protein